MRKNIDLWAPRYRPESRPEKNAWISAFASPYKKVSTYFECPNNSHVSLGHCGSVWLAVLTSNTRINSRTRVKRAYLHTIRQDKKFCETCLAQYGVFQKCWLPSWNGTLLHFSCKTWKPPFSKPKNFPLRGSASPRGERLRRSGGINTVLTLY